MPILVDCAFIFLFWAVLGYKCSRSGMAANSNILNDTATLQEKNGTTKALQAPR